MNSQKVNDEGEVLYSLTSGSIKELAVELKSMLSSEWISVDDELPDDGADVLVGRSASRGGATVEVSEFSDGEFLCFIGSSFVRFVDPTHWMLLPEPPEDKP